ncbi:MAG: hypothetical protein HW416_2011 [Chloroflexi bacterium]|nr:hypothetical protein [Chloroflexota bacterium]
MIYSTNDLSARAGQTTRAKAVTEKNVKPLGSKAYGSIPHLPGSRLGPGDHHCHEGQAIICTQRARDRHDRVIVQEKLDGSCVAVAKVGGRILALTRAGYEAHTSPWEQHQLFEAWVWQEAYERLEGALYEGERLCGEWLAQAHGTRYELPHPPFVPFDLMVRDTRLPFGEFAERMAAAGFVTPRLIHDGGPFAVDDALARLEPSGHGALDPVEGAVWRVERRGQVDFLAKFVRADKVDGVYLPEVSGAEAVWNWRPGIASVWLSPRVDTRASS